MTIMEFIAERLNEDEEDIDLAGRDNIDWRYTKADWIRRDVAAKRRMMERAELSVRYAAVALPMTTAADQAAAYHAYWVLSELAAIWGEHPDYQQEWKP